LRANYFKLSAIDDQNVIAKEEPERDMMPAVEPVLFGFQAIQIHLQFFHIGILPLL
jgi:hypothetical protein